MTAYIHEPDSIYVTNGIYNAKQLAQKGYNVFLLGGRFKAATEAAVGTKTIRVWKIYLTKGFFDKYG